MNCNCKSEIEAKLTERHATKNPGAKNHAVKLGGYGLAIIGNRMVHQGAVEITATADHMMKSGEYKAKKTISSMVWSFCPFCGKPAGHQEGGAQ